MAVFYHYTGVSNLRSIFQGGEGWGEAGLRPRARFLTLHFLEATNLPDQAYESALFGLSEPFPQNWLHTDPFLKMSQLEYVAARATGDHRGLVCLQCYADDRDLFVVERGVFFNDERQALENAPKDTQIDFLIRARIAYWNSLIPLNLYMAEGPNYILPEIVSFNPIPPSQLTIKKRYENRSAFLNDLAAHRPQI